MTLAAWGFKRIDDMTRDELIAALNDMHRMYVDVCRANMQKSPTFIAKYDWSLDEADAAAQKLFENPMKDVRSK